MSHIQCIDELIREYLLYRGFSGTLKVFDSELKLDKDKGFRVDKIVEQLMQYITTYDLNALKELWNHLDQHIFSKLEQHFTLAVRKVESSVLKLYLVNAVANNRPDKVMEFFTRYSADLQGQPEWKEWFMLPFVKSPEDSPTFAVYFTRQWQDTVLVSLQNFLATIFQCMPQPTLSSFEDDALRVRRLTEENETMRRRLAAQPVPEPPQPPQLMDDFYIIATELGSTGADTQAKTLKSFIRNIGSGLPTSPILGRKQGATKVKSLDEPKKLQNTKQRQSSTSSWNASRPQSEPVQRPISEPRPKPTPTCEVGSSTIGSVGAFLLLSQEEHGDHRAVVSQCKFSPSGSAVISSDLDGVVKLWVTTPTSRAAATFVWKPEVLALDWVTKNERYFVAGSSQGLVRLYDSHEKRLVWELGSEPLSLLRDTRVVSICCSPADSTFVCSAVGERDEGKLLLYDIKSRKLERCLSLEDGPIVVHCCALNHNGQLLMVGCSDGSVRTYDLRRAECIDRWLAHQGPVLSLQFTVDYTSCFTIGPDAKLCQRSLSQMGKSIWEAVVPDCTFLQSLTMQHGQLFSFDPTGSFVLTCGSAGGNIFKVSPSGLVPVLELGGHRHPTTSIDWFFANQCATSVTSSSDGKVRVSTLLTP